MTTRAQEIRTQVDYLDEQGMDIETIARTVGITVARVEQIIDQIEAGVPLHHEPTEPVVMQYATWPLPEEHLAPKPTKRKPAPKVVVATPRVPKPRRAVAACGTVSGYQRHKRLKEKTCEECRLAYNAQRQEYKAKRRALRPPAFVPQPCGTRGAYVRHYKRGEKPCQECKDAYNAIKRADEAAKRAAQA